MYRHARLLISGFLAAVAVWTGGPVYSGEESGPVSSHQVVKIKTVTGAECAAAFFDGGKDAAVVFVPGAVFDKASWFFMAERLQRLNIAALSLDGKTRHAVWAAVDFLKEKGFTNLTLVGGSMGGAAVLDAVEEHADICVSRIILLAPAGGAPVNSRRIHKLFITAKEDRLGLYPSVKALYAGSSDPKMFAEFEGSAHAQHLFKTPQKKALSDLIVGFISEGE